MVLCSSRVPKRAVSRLIQCAHAQVLRKRYPEVPLCRPLPVMGDREGRNPVPTETSTGAPASVTVCSLSVAKAFATLRGESPLSPHWRSSPPGHSRHDSDQTVTSLDWGHQCRQRVPRVLSDPC